MAIRILLNESNASRRVVPMWLVSSNGTTPVTNASNKSFTFAIGGVFYGSGGSLSAVSGIDGHYAACFAASRVSVLGAGQVMFGDSTCLPASTAFEVVPIDSYDSMRMGLFALPNAAAEAAGGLLTSGTGTGQLSVSNGSVGLKAQTHSQATVGGADNLGRREYSDITMRIGLVAYSGATVGIDNIKAASYSGVSLEIKTGGIQTASVGKGNYSGVSFEILTGGIQTSSIGVGSYSGVTLGIDNIKAGNYSGVTIDGLSNKTFFQTSVQSSVWSGKRSDWTTPGSFGEYAYSQVTGTSSGTVQGVTRTLSLSANDDKTGYGVTTIAAAVYSGVTIDGLSNKTFFQTSVQSSVWSGKRSDWTTPGSFGEYAYSQVTGTSSGTVQGVTRVNSGVTLNADTHSGATIAGIVTGGIIAATLASGVITAAKFGASAIDAAALATDAGQEIADRIIARNIEGGSDAGRVVREALATLRNKAAIEGSRLTVYGVDDVTSSWSATVTTGTNPIASVDPAGP